MKKRLTFVEMAVAIIMIGLMFSVTETGQAALTKGRDIVDGWTAVEANTTINGSVVDVSGNYQTTLYLDTAMTSTTAQANGATISVQVSSNSTGSDVWHTLTAFGGPTGTGGAKNLTTASTAGDTVLLMTNTTGFTPGSTYKYIKDATIGNSEIFVQSGINANANITAIDATTYSHAINTTVYNLTGQYTVNIPDSANRVRVIYDNKNDASGSSMDVRSRLTKITAI